MIPEISLPLDSIITMRLKMQELLMEPVSVKVLKSYADITIKFETKDRTYYLMFFNFQFHEYDIKFQWRINKSGDWEYGTKELLCSYKELEDWSKESSFYDRIFEPIKNYINSK